MRRILLLLGALLVLTACAKLPPSVEPPQSAVGQPPNQPEPAPSQPSEPIPPAPAAPQPPPQPTSTAPQPPPQWSPDQREAQAQCVAAAILEKGAPLLRDGGVSLYRLAAGAYCGEQFAESDWLLMNGTAVELLPVGVVARSATALDLPGGHRGYVLRGESVTPSASAHYLVAVAGGQQHLYHFKAPIYDVGQIGDGQGVLSSVPPEIRDDEFRVAQRVSNSPPIYATRIWKLDPQNFTATLIRESEG